MASNSPAEQPKSPLREITQPFIDLIHAPRALWGVNLAYLIEGMVYFGMLGYLTIYCSEFIFQAIDGADEVAHYMVMVLTAGITIAMFFLGMVADKRGVRFALVAAFIMMLAGRFVWAAAPTLFGLEPTRPGVVAGDKVSLHVTRLETRYGNKTITQATPLKLEENAVAVDQTMKVDLSAGEGLPPDEGLESRLVQLGRVQLIEGEGPDWKVQYGSKPVTARMLIHGADELKLRPGAFISVDRAYVARKDEEQNKKSTKPPALRAGTKITLNQAWVVAQGENGELMIRARWPEDVAAIDSAGCVESGAEYILRSHWISDIAAVNTFPPDLAAGDGVALDPAMTSREVRLSEATLKEGKGGEWIIEYGGKRIVARLVFGGKAPGLNSDDMIADIANGPGLALDENLAGKRVHLGKATLISKEAGKREWLIQYGTNSIAAPLEIRSSKDLPLSAGATVSICRAKVVRRENTDQPFALRAQWPEDVAAVDTFGCQESPYKGILTREEKDLKAKSRWTVAAHPLAPQGASEVTIAQLRATEDGPVNAVLRDVSVTYVRGGGYLVQEAKDGPAIAVFVSPLWSGLQIATMVGMILVVIGYGMYQPAAYAGVRKFTTPKTAAMGFAMLYALMNLGGWLPTFAFLVRDDNYLGLGIRGMFWVYAGFTVVALLVTVFILNRRTVAEAETSAKAETASLQADDAAARQAKKVGEHDTASASGSIKQTGVKPHLWLLWAVVIALLLFKGEAPWYYSWGEVSKAWATDGPRSMAVLHWIIAGLFFVSPVFFATIPKLRNWISNHPLQDAKFAFFIFALIPVQTLFTYNWLVLPPYIKRAYAGWIGEYFEIASNANPILIFIAVPIITALTQKKRVYNMMILGTLVMAAPAFLLSLGPYWWTLAAYIFIMTIGEAMWQPRFLQYAAQIAPEGRTGEYMGVAQLPWFLTKVLVPLLYSGRMMDRFCPAEGPKNTQTMWLIFALIAMCSTIMLTLAKRWAGKDFKTHAA